MTTWWQPPNRLLVIAAGLAQVAGSVLLAIIIAVGDAWFYPMLVAVATVVLLIGGARLARTGHHPSATILGVTGGTLAGAFVLVAYGYSQIPTVQSHPFTLATMILVGIVYALCAAISIVLAPRKMGASGVLIAAVTTGTLLTVGGGSVLLLWILCSTVGCGS